MAPLPVDVLLFWEDMMAPVDTVKLYVKQDYISTQQHQGFGANTPDHMEHEKCSTVAGFFACFLL